ncbi:hypothetical protein [Kribbella shirazensis]|uniref:Uncharacterized protein n=1 Tax=Kribbella shirazensis TaxID=1105143 RepID=A0A7X5ZZ10_9ACTN|nr:hypothetical protein [Kribbella shirazensis]NIK55716.1 hypothetical protein [Kribbella shirazensis]
MRWRHRDEPGLHVTYATDEFLLATKLVAQRRKDAADIVLLAERLQMKNPSAAELEQVIHRHYTDKDSLELILDGDDIDREIHFLAVRAERLLEKHRSDPTDATRTRRRMDRSTFHERS